MSFAITAIAAGAGYALAGSATGALLGAGIGASIAGSQAASRAGSQQAAAAEQAAGVQSEASVRAAEIQAEAATRAAEIQAQSAREAAAIQQQIADRQIEEARRTFGEQKGFLQPYQQPGLNALARIQAGIAPGGEFARPFTMDQFQADPGYAFRLSEGQKALERQAAARGGLISGPALKAASRFGQEMGSQEFQNAFTRAQTERANALNPLLALYGTGAETAGALSGAAGGMGSSIGSFLGQSGQAQAAGLLGAGQAAAGGITGAAGAGAQGVYGAGQAGAQGLLGAAQARTSGYLGAANTLMGGLGQTYNLYQQQQLLNQLARPTTSPFSFIV
jgi:hypothetical protein